MRHFSNEGSPYWNYHKAELDELPQANPDVLAEGIKWFQQLILSEDEEESLQAYERVLSKYGLTFLTAKQRVIWTLFCQGSRLTQIADECGIKLPGVYRHLIRIGKKIKKKILKERNIPNGKKKN